MGSRGASAPVGSEPCLSREIRKHTIPRHVRAGAVDKFLNVDSPTGEDWKVDALDEEALRRKVANVMEAQQRLHKVVEERRRKTANGNGKLLEEGSYRTLRWEII